ncbi:MAG: C/D box methylation guide ribonucleoprotein complex aNOP56 subunit [Thermoprotei archaeon]|nr:C/D box methylation guide ribonucleoprotein complex aNOP56 subunit [Thermoprotei archaeon]
MRAYLVENIYGIFALDEDGNIIDKELFPSDPNQVAEKLLKLESGELVEELRKLCTRLKDKGYNVVIVEDEGLGRNIVKETGLEAQFKLPSKGGRTLRGRIFQIGPELGLFKDVEEYITQAQRIALIMTRMKVRAAAEKRDLFIAQAITAIDEIDRTLNLFASRLREWYSLHFPELDDMVRDHKDYSRLIYELGFRSNFTRDKLAKLGMPSKMIDRIERAAKESMGADLTDFDLKPIMGIARIALDLFKLRSELRDYIDEAMKEVAPNIRELVGPLLGARLIALAGGLNKLATLPASTIQVLGAEKALFRALRTGSKPPKHGVIFQYPAVHRSPRWQRGKIARALAGKLAIAARVDAFSGEFIARELKEQLERRIEEIKKLYAKPPKRKVRRGRRKRRGRR